MYKLQAVLNAAVTGVHEDAKLTMEPYLLEWVELKKLTLKPSTAPSYEKSVHNDLLPTLGRMRLVDLNPQHVTDWMNGLRTRGRGAPAEYRLGATLRSALSTLKKSCIWWSTTPLRTRWAHGRRQPSARAGTRCRPLLSCGTTASTTTTNWPICSR